MEIQKVNFNVSYGLRLRFPLGGKLLRHTHFSNVSFIIVSAKKPFI